VPLLLKGFATAVYALIGTAGYLMFGNDVYDEVITLFFYSSILSDKKNGD
jgi:amino acid permease